MRASVKTKCQAAVLRYVHDVVAGEFLNIGVVLFCPDRRFIACRFLPSWQRLTAAFPDAQPVHLRRAANYLTTACAEWQSSAQTELALEPVTDLRSFLAKLVPPDDSALQFSPTVSGLTADPEKTLQEVFERYVGRFVSREERVGRDDGDVWRDIASRVTDALVLKRLKPRVLKVSHYEYAFQYAWKNGSWNALQPVSLDMSDAKRIVEKATQWSGRLLTLKPAEQDMNVSLVLGLPRGRHARALTTAANDAVAILRDNLAGQAEVVLESDVEPLVSKMTKDLIEH